jgi:hypothetical protein
LRLTDKISSYGFHGGRPPIGGHSLIGATSRQSARSMATAPRRSGAVETDDAVPGGEVLRVTLGALLSCDKETSLYDALNAEIAVLDDPVHRFSAASELTLREQVAKTLARKIWRLGQRLLGATDDLRGQRQTIRRDCVGAEAGLTHAARQYAGTQGAAQRSRALCLRALNEAERQVGTIGCRAGSAPTRLDARMQQYPLRRYSFRSNVLRGKPPPKAVLS